MVSTFVYAAKKVMPLTEGSHTGVWSRRRPNRSRRENILVYLRGFQVSHSCRCPYYCACPFSSFACVCLSLSRLYPSLPMYPRLSSFLFRHLDYGSFVCKSCFLWSCFIHFLLVFLRSILSSSLLLKDAILLGFQSVHLLSVAKRSNFFSFSFAYFSFFFLICLFSKLSLLKSDCNLPLLVDDISIAKSCCNLKHTNCSEEWGAYLTSWRNTGSDGSRDRSPKPARRRSAHRRQTDPRSRSQSRGVNPRAQSPRIEAFLTCTRRGPATCVFSSSRS